jgi:hypothetical protein
LNWDTAYQACNNSPYGGNHATGWSTYAYVGGGKMPSREEIERVSNTDFSVWGFANPQTGQGAALAAGWPDALAYSYWTGEAGNAPTKAYLVDLMDGSNASKQADDPGVLRPVACRR